MEDTNNPVTPVAKVANKTPQVKITKTLNDVLQRGFESENFSINNKNSREVEVAATLKKRGLAEVKFETEGVSILSLTDEGKNAALVINGAYGYLVNNF
jgi:hypothetical protein